jgi:hypothetical protein
VNGIARHPGPLTERTPAAALPLPLPAAAAAAAAAAAVYLLILLHLLPHLLVRFCCIRVVGVVAVGD